VDGDVARAAFPDQRRYDVLLRMVRGGDGVWRIQSPPINAGEWRRSKLEHEQQLERWTAERPQREKDVLEHLDKYPTPGSVLDELDVVRAEAKTERAKQPQEAQREVESVRKEIATQPAATPQEEFGQQMRVALSELGAAFTSHNPEAAAKFYYVQGDDGSYALAREKRTLATAQLIDAADREIDSGAERVAYELQLIDLAD